MLAASVALICATVPVRVTKSLPLPPMPALLSPPTTLFATVSVPLSTDSVVVMLPLASGSLIAMPLIAVPTPSVALTGVVGTVLLASSTAVTLIVTVAEAEVSSPPLAVPPLFCTANENVAAGVPELLAAGV